MARAKKYRKIFPPASWFQTAACLILFLLSLNFSYFSIFQTQSNAELIYCPLQKEWVKPNLPESEIKYEPLKYVCAVNNRKNSFLNRANSNVFARQMLSDAWQTENLFFNYAEKGNQTFAEISFPSNIPAPNLVKTGEIEKYLQNFQTDFARQISIATIPPQLPRPPPIRRINFFETSFIHALNKITRRLAPRAPPVSV